MEERPLCSEGALPEFFQLPALVRADWRYIRSRVFSPWAFEGLARARLLLFAADKTGLGKYSSGSVWRREPVPVFFPEHGIIAWTLERGTVVFGFVCNLGI